MKNRPLKIRVTPELEVFDDEEFTHTEQDVLYIRADSLLDALIQSGMYDIQIIVRENDR